LVSFNVLMVAISLSTGFIKGIYSSIIIVMLAAIFEVVVVYLYVKKNKATHLL